MNGAPRRLEIVDQAADTEFRRRARSLGENPDDPFLGGYADRVWGEIADLIEAYAGDLHGLRVLEFGCNIGGSAIVLSRLGATVSAVDIDRVIIGLAETNARRYGADRISFLTVMPSPEATLPFPDAKFDLILCNSVLEYVSPASLIRPILRQLDRVLKPGGVILILGTSSRLAPREVHSRRWLVNYVPRGIDWLTGRSIRRGIWPGAIRRGLAGYRDLVFEDRGRAYFVARRAAGLSPLKLTILRLAALLARPLGWSVGMLTSSFSVALRKPRNSQESGLRADAAARTASLLRRDGGRSGTA